MGPGMSTTMLGNIQLHPHFQETGPSQRPPPGLSATGHWPGCSPAAMHQQCTRLRVFISPHTHYVFNNVTE